METLTLKPIMFFLGLCSGFIPNNIQLSSELCFKETEAKSRIILVANAFDDFEREYFNWQVNKTIGRK